MAYTFVIFDSSNGSIISVDIGSANLTDIGDNAFLTENSTSLTKLEAFGAVSAKTNGLVTTNISVSGGVDRAYSVLENIYSAGVTLLEFNLKTATLEDVFIQKTGRSLEEENGEEEKEMEEEVKK